MWNWFIDFFISSLSAVFGVWLYYSFFRTT